MILDTDGNYFILSVVVFGRSRTLVYRSFRGAVSWVFMICRDNSACSARSAETSAANCRSLAISAATTSHRF